MSSQLKDDLPTIKNSLISTFDDYGTSSGPKLKSVRPIMGSEKKAIAGKKGNIREKMVGYIAYSDYFKSLAYLVEKRQKNIIRKVYGGGFGVSKKIIEELKNDNVDYIFGRMIERDTILVFPIEAFSNEYHIQGWDKQLYAVVSKDVICEIPNSSEVYSNFPSKSDNSLTMSKALEKINS